MKLRSFLLALLLCLLCVSPAHALEYDFDGAEDYPFGSPTSDESVTEPEDPNVDRCKGTALIPPGFGTPTSYLPGSGEALTPNLIPGALSGGLVPQVGSVSYPSVDVSGDGYSAMDTNLVTYSTAESYGGYTEVTDDLYYSDGSLGTLQIPAIGLTVKVVQGTDSSALAKGAGHFTGTSIWDGNVSLAAHNRGTNAFFGQIHTLNQGDIITLTTALGTRTYVVTSVQKVLETDTSGTAATSDNRLTLYTCVRDERDYRWCVTAIQQA